MVFFVLGGIATATALQQIYEKAFDLPHWRMRDILHRLAWLAVLLPAIRHVGDCHAVPAMTRRASTRGLRSRHPRTAQFLSHTERVYLRLIRLLDFRQDTPTHISKRWAQ